MRAAGGPARQGTPAGARVSLRAGVRPGLTPRTSPHGPRWSACRLGYWSNNGIVRGSGLPPSGPSTLELPRPEGGTRLVYARGPMGRETYMVDLDASGRVQRWHQALGPAQFAQLPIGAAREELLYRLGPPAEVSPAGRLPGTVWSWRYPNNDCLWFQAGVDEAGRYTGGASTQDPRCDVNDRQP